MGTGGQIVTFVGAQTVCEGTGAFRFSRPPGYRFEAGQFLSLTLDTREGTQTKPFSHSDAPGDSETQIITRLTGSAFKDALLALTPGDTVSVSGPGGRLTLPADADRVAFLVGGVGITPMRSIVRDSVQKGSALEVLVFDANVHEDCIPLREEFDAWEREHPRIRVVHVLEHASATWTGESGYIGAETVLRHCDPLDGWQWFVSGPPAMVDAMRRVLETLDVEPGRASFESFAGYR